MAMSKLSLSIPLFLLLLFSEHVLAIAQRGMIKLSARHQHSGSAEPVTVANEAGAVPAGEADPGLRLSQDTDADLPLQHDEAMRLFMRTKAESVIASHSGDSLSPDDVSSILTGDIPSLYPGSLANISWTTDLFETGTTLPTVSSKPAPVSMGSMSLLSTSTSSSASSLDNDTPDSTNAFADEHDLNHDGIVSVDELLQSFFHADDVKFTFEMVQSHTNQKLGKERKKDIIKNTAPVLHNTIQKVAGHRGWGIQDARFAQLHQETGDQGQGAFKDYNTFVKTMRSALITPTDSAEDSVREQEQEQGPTARTDPSNKA